MKKRYRLVSNSSSSSFVIALNKLDENDLIDLENYMNSENNIDNWTYYINYETGLIEGETIMCNGNFPEWVEKKGLNKVKFIGGY